jgi:hypothetical protein
LERFSSLDDPRIPGANSAPVRRRSSTRPFWFEETPRYLVAREKRAQIPACTHNALKLKAIMSYPFSNTRRKFWLTRLN